MEQMNSQIIQAFVIIASGKKIAKRSVKLVKLNKIQIDVNLIKENMHDEDSQLTEEEEKLLKESYENETSGKLICLKLITP